MQLPVLANLLDISFERADPMADLPAIHFQFGFAGTSRADSAAQTREVFSMAGQSRQPIFQLCKLNLKFAFLRARAVRKDIENQTGTIDDFGIERFLEILRLAGRKLVQARLGETGKPTREGGNPRLQPWGGCQDANL